MKLDNYEEELGQDFIVCDRCKVVVERKELYHGRCPGCDNDTFEEKGISTDG